jgi:hypothetical protein
MSKTKQQPRSTVSIDTHLSKDDLKQVLIDTYHDIESGKDRKKHDAKIEWQHKMGLDRKSTAKNSVIRSVQSFWYDLFAFFKLIYVKKQDVSEDMATTGLIKLTLKLIFFILQISLIIAAIGFIVVPILNIYQSGVTITTGIFLAVFAFILSRLFRIAGFEIENIKERDYLVALFSGITSFAALIIAIIALVKE